jgi:hypothetical protein
MKKSLFLAAAVLAASGAQAQQTASTTVNAVAGLAPVMTLTCTDVNFGVWTVPSGDRGGVTTLTMSVNAPDSATATETIAVSGVTTVAQIYPDTAGRCVVQGAWNTLTAAINGNSGMAFGTSNHIVALGNVKVPTVTNSNVSANLTLSTTTPSVNANSEAFFYVVGTLTIPNNLITGNYGGYRANTPATVSVTQ